MIRSLTKQEVESNPFSVWNAFVDLVAMSKYAELSAEQRVAHLTFWYESEVQNGGHLQYFENRGTEYLTETIQALGVLGAIYQQQILQEAGKLWLNRPRSVIQTAQEFCDTALAGEFASFDSRFHACSPNLQKHLETYLNEHQSSFVCVI